MGNFYVNVTLKGPAQDDIVGHLKEGGGRAFVSPTVGRVTTITGERCDLMYGLQFLQFASELSKHFDCPSFAVLNHDDDTLMYWLFDKGGLDHEYESQPGDVAGADGQHKGETDGASKGGDAQALCSALGCPGDVDAIGTALRQSSAESGKFIFAFERHAALLKALGIPETAVGMGWAYLQQGEFPPGLARSDFVEI